MRWAASTDRCRYRSWAFRSCFPAALPVAGAHHLLELVRADGGYTGSLVEFGFGGSAAFTGAIAKEILHQLRLAYFTPEQAKNAGFIGMPS
ncbi:hypothetical protein ACIGXM_28410 [Kitasatospora sp. NPDC052896]|uniref:hypothetical protein n=1 Tax=Kitasatospora sp. NPDC052896 TaxID=3364061 RepID=UPI0037C5529A